MRDKKKKIENEVLITCKSEFEFGTQILDSPLDCAFSARVTGIKQLASVNICSVEGNSVGIFVIKVSP